MDCIFAVLVTVVELNVRMLKEHFDDMYFAFPAGEHEETHLHSINVDFTLVLGVIYICS